MFPEKFWMHYYSTWILEGIMKTEREFKFQEWEYQVNLIG